jgi:ribulose-phosphate 3-epimerase
MMRKIESLRLAPSILTADFGRLAEEIQAAEIGGADVIHLDVMDGRFVPNITFGPLIVETVRKATTLPLDVHLMIQEPDRYVADFIRAGANNLTVHWEAVQHLHRTVVQITELGCKVGVALNPATPVESVREILPFVDLVLVMTVDPGFGGQRFIETSTSKVRRLQRLIAELNPTCDLQVDGGIGVDNIADVARAGATIFVVGSSVYNQYASVTENLTALRQALLGIG